MAFITNQWLKGNPKRRRPHSPVRVTLQPGDLQRWDRDNGVLVSIEIKKPGGDHQDLLFGAEDIPVLARAINRGDSDVAQQLVTHLFREMFPIVLADALSAAVAAVSSTRRVAPAKKKAPLKKKGASK